MAATPMLSPTVSSSNVRGVSDFCLESNALSDLVIANADGPQLHKCKPGTMQQQHRRSVASES
jgi:hypothetical protein